jgi:predicted ATPase
MLLVLDNYEHVIEAAAALAVDTLRGRRACGFWRPAASRYAPRANTCTVCHRCESPRTARQLFRCRGSQLPGRLCVERAAATMNEFVCQSLLTEAEQKDLRRVARA